MQYSEMNYTQKREFEKTLTTAQRGKLRKMQKQHEEQIQPIGWASHAREEEVRKEAWVSLNCAERIKEVEAEARPRLAEIEKQIEALREEYKQISDAVSETRSSIQVETYTAAGNDPEAKAMRAIWRKTKEVQERKFNELAESFQKVEA